MLKSLPNKVQECINSYDDRIRALCEHFVNEVKWDEIYENRLCEEFDIIQQKNFIQCFEQVTYIVGYMRSQNIPSLCVEVVRVVYFVICLVLLILIL